ncbi:MAG: hypothetical protein KAT43_05690 [Nanoarchaeota archaeon]|nr:hypothetical protein [Nanoarchaeota archaeon]
MNIIEKFFTAMLLVFLVVGFFYLLFTINAVDESNALKIVGASVLEYQTESVKFAIDNELFVLKELESRNIRFNGKDHQVILINVNAENDPFCQVIVDGEITNKLHVGESESILGLEIKIGEIHT